jgi:SpoVK/Ycf46/Vps4 family AAA+-type ATPase
MPPSKLYLLDVMLSFRLHTSRMSLSEDVDLEEFVMTKDDLSGADIKAVCTEAGLLALRERRMRVTKADFTSAREKVSNLPSNLLVVLMLIVSRRFCTGKTRERQKGYTCNTCPEHGSS